MNYYNFVNISRTKYIINKIAIDAKNKHTLIYLKFIYSNFINYHKNLSKPVYFYFNELITRSFWVSNKNEMLFCNPDSSIMQMVFKEYEGVVTGKFKKPYIDKLLNEDKFYKKNP